MNLTHKQDVIAILWDNNDSTIVDIMANICPLVDEIGYKSSVGRCYNEETDKNDSECLYFSMAQFGGKTSHACRVGEYVTMDVTNKVMPVICLSEKELFKRYKKI